MTLRGFRLPIAACAGLAFLSFMTAASGAVMGHLDIANCAGGGVTVNATTIDWTLPVGGGTGCIQTGAGTNVTYTGGGPLLPGVTGTILDLILTPGLPPVPDFMTFVGNPNLHFDLTALGPGVSNTTCAGVLNPNLPACSASPGSPFILAPTATGTAITLSATGIARDASGPNATFLGAFTTQIAGVTPLSIQTTIAGGGSITSTQSGDFTITVVPEPSTVTMAALGGLFVALFASRRKSRV
jgi:hypothetical protein